MNRQVRVKNMSFFSYLSPYFGIKKMRSKRRKWLKRMPKNLRKLKRMRNNSLCPK